MATRSLVAQNAYMSLGIDVDHDVDVAVKPCVPASERTEDCGTSYAQAP